MDKHQQYQRPVYCYQIRGSLDYGYKLWLESGNQVKLGVYENGNYAELNTTLALSTNNWHHVVAQIGNDASDFKIYIDGLSLGTTTNNSGTLPGNTDNVAFMTVGGESMNSKPFSGKMKDVRMYTRVLTADEIAAHYSGGCGTNNLYLNSLVLWDKMNDGTGSTVQDYSTYGGVYPHTGSTMLWGREVNTTCTSDRKVAIEMNGRGYRFGFNGKEMDNEVAGDGNQYDYGARIYNPRIARWLSVDPLATKYPYESPFAFVGNSPIVIVDPNGKEKIVVIGQPGDHLAHPDNFTKTGLSRAESLKQKAGSEQVTMILYASANAADIQAGRAYSAKQIQAFQKQANAAGIKTVIVHSSEEIVNYVNEKTGGDTRDKDLISNFTYVGHSGCNGLEVNYMANGRGFGDDPLDVSDFDAGAFTDNSEGHLENGCNSANDELCGNSSAKKLATKVGKAAYGSTKKTDYTGTSKKVKTEKELQSKKKGSESEIKKYKGSGGVTNAKKSGEKK